MNVQDAYFQFLQKVNKNIGSRNITADKPRFVSLYNEAQVKRLLYVLNNASDLGVREIHYFLKPNTDLAITNTFLDRVVCELPEDYLDFSSAYALATKGKCKDKKISLWEIKNKNYTVVDDNYNAPSFDYREAPVSIANNWLNIFTKDFTINKAVLTYYRYPKSIDIEGYVKGGKASQNINPEGDKRFIDRVITMAALDFARNNSDTQDVQIEKDRARTN